jgi:cytochrome P450
MVNIWRTVTHAEYSKTVSTLASFIMAMVMNPDVQKKAQSHIDSVLGHSRLPEISDRGSIPYVDAVMYETLRYYPVVPLGTISLLIPHTAS